MPYSPFALRKQREWQQASWLPLPTRSVPCAADAGVQNFGQADGHAGRTRIAAVIIYSPMSRQLAVHICISGLSQSSGSRRSIFAVTALVGGLFTRRVGRLSDLLAVPAGGGRASLALEYAAFVTTYGEFRSDRMEVAGTLITRRRVFQLKARIAGCVVFVWGRMPWLSDGQWS